MVKINYCSTVEPDKEKYYPSCGERIPWVKGKETIGFDTTCTSSSGKIFDLAYRYIQLENNKKLNGRT